MLVVEDEPSILLFVTRALTAAGYDVLEADTAERALELLASEGRPVSLLLSDFGLPGASGAELIEQARQILSDLPAQLMSATPKQWLVSDRMLAEDADVLQKPFRVGDLPSRLERRTR